MTERESSNLGIDAVDMIFDQAAPHILYDLAPYPGNKNMKGWMSRKIARAIHRVGSNSLTLV